MSTFSGRQGKGAMREHCATKRAEAETRNARSLALFLNCGHSTALTFAEHAARCGVSA